MTNLDNTLILFTKNYPFGTGEEFIENEIQVLSKKFLKIIIIACETSKKDKQTRMLPKNVRVIRLYGLPPKIKFLYFIIKSLIYIRRKEFRNEIIYAPTFKAKIFTAYYYSKVETIFKSCKKNLIDNYDFENTNLFLYSYWFFDIAQVALKLKYTFFNKKNILVVSRAHGYDLFSDRNYFNFIPFRRWCMKKVDLIFPCSELGANWLKAQFPLEENKIKVGYLGTRDLKLQDYRRNKKFHIVTCSNIINLKRVRRLAESLYLISKKGNNQIKWTCFGTGPLLEDLKLFCNEYLKDLEISFMGYQPNSKVLDFYKNNNVDIFVNVSEQEGLPVSIMEAMSFGIPAVATDVGGSSEIVINNVTGIILKQEFSNMELSDAINYIVNMNDFDYYKLRENARNFWKENFDANKNYEEFSDFLLNYKNQGIANE